MAIITWNETLFKTALEQQIGKILPLIKFKNYTTWWFLSLDGNKKGRNTMLWTR